MCADWQDFSVLTELEQLVATCEAILGRLLSERGDVSREQFHSPAGIEYVLSIVRSGDNARDGGSASSSKPAWLARSVLSPASASESADARLSALCDWACFPVVAVITHAFSSSDFFGEISGSQAGSLLSALHLALMHAGLGGEVPAIVQIYEPSRAAFIGCWPSSASATDAASFVRFKSDAAFYTAPSPYSSVGSAALSDPSDASSALPSLPPHLATPRGALVQFCSRLLPPEAHAQLRQPPSPDSPWNAYRRRLRSASSVELCTAFGVTPSLRLTWAFACGAPRFTAGSSRKGSVGDASSAESVADVRNFTRMFTSVSQLLPSSLESVEFQALWSALPAWRDSAATVLSPCSSFCYIAAGSHQAAAEGSSSPPDAAAVISICAALDTDSGWPGQANAGSGLLQAGEAKRCTAFTVRARWVASGALLPAGVQTLLRRQWRRWTARAAAAPSTVLSALQSGGSCCRTVDSEPVCGETGVLSGASIKEHGSGLGDDCQWGVDDAGLGGPASAAAVPFAAVTGAFDEGRQPSAWFSAAALIGAVAAHTLVQEAADAAAAAAAATDGPAPPLLNAQQAEESAAAYGLEAWAAMAPEPPPLLSQPALQREAAFVDPHPAQPRPPEPRGPEEAEELHGAAGGGGGITHAPGSASPPPRSQPKGAARQKRPVSPFSPLRSDSQAKAAGVVRDGGAGDADQPAAPTPEHADPSEASTDATAVSGPRFRGTVRPHGLSGFAPPDDSESVAPPDPAHGHSARRVTEDGPADANPPPPRRTRRRSRLRAALRLLPGYAIGARVGGALAGAAADIAASAAATLPPTHLLATPPRPAAAGAPGGLRREEVDPEATPSHSQQRRLAATAAAWAQQEALTAATTRSCVLLASRGAVAEAVRWVFGPGEEGEQDHPCHGSRLLLAARLELAFSALAALAVRRAPELQRGAGGTARPGPAEAAVAPLRARWRGVAVCLDTAAAPDFGALRMGLTHDAPGTDASPSGSLLRRLDAAAARAAAASRGDDACRVEAVAEGSAGATGGGMGDLCDALASHASAALMCVLWHAFVSECRRRWDAGDALLPHTGGGPTPGTGAPSLLQQWCDLLSACMSQRAALPAPRGRASGGRTALQDSLALEALLLQEQQVPAALPRPAGRASAASPRSTTDADAPPSPSSVCSRYEDACGSEAEGPALTVRELRLSFPGGAAAAVAALLRGGDGVQLLLGDCDCDDNAAASAPPPAAAAPLRGAIVCVPLRLVTAPVLLPAPLRRTDLHAAEDARALAAMGLGGLRSVRRRPPPLEGSDGSDGSEGSEGGLSLRVLLADMAAFKATNAGAGVLDFVRWYCPPSQAPGAPPEGDTDGAALLTALEAAEAVSVELLQPPETTEALEGGGAEDEAAAARPADPALIGAALRALRAAHRAATDALGGLRAAPRIVLPTALPPSPSSPGPPRLTLAWAAPAVDAADAQLLHVWRSVWAAATPAAALRPLFDPLREGELALHALETLTPSDVAGQLTALAGQRLTGALEAAQPPATPLSASHSWGAVQAAAAADAAAQLGAASLQVHGAALRAHSRSTTAFGGAAAAAVRAASDGAPGQRPLTAAAHSLQLWDALATDVLACRGRAAALAAAMLPTSASPPTAAAASLAAALSLPPQRDPPPPVLAACAGARAAALRLLRRCGGGGEPAAPLLPPPHQRSLQLVSDWGGAHCSRGAEGGPLDPATLPLGSRAGAAGASQDAAGAPASPLPVAAPQAPPQALSSLVVVTSYDPRAADRALAGPQRVGLRVAQALRLQGL